ncbi:DIRC2 [Cordylochernes scorpioides]|uniref:DIRC2 n=1 Tax=Cordylochernes scorpioides TaxID=51811 RepID=A0ABY6LJ67_9ARAC|nr:DIRC2 [Cordylochernes scorpioides]
MVGSGLRLFILSVQVYKRRWLVLGLFSLLNFTNSVIWITWSSISESARLVFGWSDGTIALLLNWGNVPYVLFSVPICWYLTKHGAYTSNLLIHLLFGACYTIYENLVSRAAEDHGTGYHAHGSGVGDEVYYLRSGESHTMMVSEWSRLIHCGQLLNGMAGVVFNSLPSQVSAVWFPTQERTTATSAMITFSTLGVAGGYFLGPRLVHFDQPDPPCNSTELIHCGQLLNGMAGVVFNSLPSQVSAVWFPTQERTTATSAMITFSTLGVAGGYFLGPRLVHFDQPDPPCNSTDQNPPAKFFTALLLFVVVFLGFREQPPRPPTASATLERLEMADSFRALKGNLNFWIVALGFAVTNGISSNWLGILGPALEDLHVTQEEAGRLGTYSTLVGCLSSLLISRLVDMVGGYIKLCLLALWVVCGANFVVYTCMYLHIIPHPKALLYVSVTITGILAYTGIPLYMELSAEITYPVSEGFVGVVLQTMVNIVGTMFLGIFLIPHIGVGWMNWCLIGSAVVGIVLVILQKEDYQRSNFDMMAADYQVVAADQQQHMEEEEGGGMSVAATGGGGGARRAATGLALGSLDVQVQQLEL